MPERSAAKPLCGADWPTPCEDCVGSCGIEEYEAESAATFREYEVEVMLTVTAPDRLEAEDAVRRSGLAQGALIGEALVDIVTVYGPEDE